MNTVWFMICSGYLFVKFYIKIMLSLQIVQESVIQIPRKIRICYYVTIYIVTLGLLVYNFTPLSGTEDPFNIGPTFLAYFAGKHVYCREFLLE